MSSTEQTLAAVARARTDSGEEDELFQFYERLLRALIDKKESLSLQADQLYRAEEAAELVTVGRPHLSFDALALEPATFYPWFLEIAALFDSRDPGVIDEAETVEQPESVALAREWYEQNATERGPTIDALLANAMIPYLEKAAGILHPLLPLAEWEEDFCPICGGYPDFVLRDPRRSHRTLLCERCATPWERPEEGCIFCGESDPERYGFYSTEDELYRVDVCDNCGHYLKGMDQQVASDLGIEPEPAAERLLTPGLDLLAIQEGYSRPAAFHRHEE